MVGIERDFNDLVRIYSVISILSIHVFSVDQKAIK